MASRSPTCGHACRPSAGRVDTEYLVGRSHLNDDPGRTPHRDAPHGSAEVPFVRCTTAIPAEPAPIRGLPCYKRDPPAFCGSRASVGRERQLEERRVRQCADAEVRSRQSCRSALVVRRHRSKSRLGFQRAARWPSESWLSTALTDNDDHGGVMTRTVSPATSASRSEATMGIEPMYRALQALA